MKTASNRRYPGLWHLLTEQAIRWSTGCGAPSLSLLPLSLSDWPLGGEEPGGLTGHVPAIGIWI